MKKKPKKVAAVGPIEAAIASMALALAKVNHNLRVLEAEKNRLVLALDAIRDIQKQFRTPSVPEQAAEKPCHEEKGTETP
jgi:hypothetical protein